MIPVQKGEKDKRNVSILGCEHIDVVSSYEWSFQTFII